MSGNVDLHVSATAFHSLYIKSSIKLKTTLSSLLSWLSWSFLWRLSLASNSKSLTSLRNHSTSWSFSSNCPCPVVPDIVWCVWYDPSLRPDFSSSRSRSLSSRLFFLQSRHVDPWEDPTDPLSTWSPKRPSSIFPVHKSLVNHSFVRDSHRQHQLCVPNVRLLG